MQLKHVRCDKSPLAIHLFQRGSRYDLVPYMKSYTALPQLGGENYGIFYTNGSILSDDLLVSKEFSSELPATLFVGQPKVLNPLKTLEWKAMLEIPKSGEKEFEHFMKNFFIFDSQPSISEIEIVIKTAISNVTPILKLQRMIRNETKILVETLMHSQIGIPLTSSLYDKTCKQILFSEVENISYIPVLPHVNEKCFGREQESNVVQKNVHCFVNQNETEPKNIIITGPLGIGKTLFMLHEYEKVDSVKNKIWLNTHTISTLLSDLKSVLSKYNIIDQTSNITVASAIDLLIKLLNDSNTLLCLDDINTNTEFVINLFKKQKNVFILATSTNKEQIPDFENINLSYLTVTEAAEMIQCLLKESVPYEVTALANCCYHHPHVLQLACAYISHKKKLPGLQSYTIQQFIGDFQDKNQLLNKNMEMKIHQVLDLILTEISTSITDDINKDLLLKILHILGVVTSDVIELNLILEIIDENKEEVLEALYVLQKYNILHYKGNYIVLHPVIVKYINSSNTNISKTAKYVMEKYILYFKKHQSTYYVQEHLYITLKFLLSQDLKEEYLPLIETLLQTVYLSPDKRLDVLKIHHHKLVSLKGDSSAHKYSLLLIKLLYATHDYKQSISNLDIMLRDEQLSDEIKQECIIMSVLLNHRVTNTEAVKNLFYKHSNTVIFCDIQFFDLKCSNVPKLMVELAYSYSKKDKSFTFFNAIITKLKERIKKADSNIEITADTVFIAAECLRLVGRSPEAIILCEDLLKESIHNSAAVIIKCRMGYASFLQDVGRTDDALAQYNSVLAYPLHSFMLNRVLIKKGKLQCDEGKVIDAQTTYTKLMISKGRVVNKYQLPVDPWQLWQLFQLEQKDI